jgi:hypothetical protein
MRSSNLKTVTVVSSAGSGNIFCQKLIKYNLQAKLRWVNHDIEKADKDGINILIVRDPYKSISSALELMFDTFTEEEKEMFNKYPEFVDNKIRAEAKSYLNRLDHSKKNNYIYPVTFEFLTGRPEEFLDYISKKFEIPYLDTRISAEEILHKISITKDLHNRIPRNKSNIRKTIEYYVNNNEVMGNTYSKYIQYKDILQSTENML